MNDQDTRLDNARPPHETSAAAVDFTDAERERVLVVESIAADDSVIAVDHVPLGEVVDTAHDVLEANTDPNEVGAAALVLEALRRLVNGSREERFDDGAAGVLRVTPA